VGGLNAWKSQSGSMMLGLPEWIVYAAWCRRWLLTAVIALAQALGAKSRCTHEPHPLTLLIFGLHAGADGVAHAHRRGHVCRRAAGYVLQAGWLPLANFLNTQAFARFASYDLSVIPLFILMGNFATQGGISKALFQFARPLMARFKGGLAMAAVMACAAFGAICGSSAWPRRPPSPGGAARDAQATVIRVAWPPARWPPAARWAS
jgi:hypothetical protein